MAPNKISGFVQAILKPNKKGRTVRSERKKKDSTGGSSSPSSSCSPSSFAGKPPRKPTSSSSRAPSTPLSSRTLSTCGSSSSLMMSVRSSGLVGASTTTTTSSSRSRSRCRIYSEDDETCTSNTMSSSEGYSSSSSPSASPSPSSRHRRPLYPLLQQRGGGHSRKESFRVRRRNRALSDRDFDELITVSCGWAYDPSEEFMPEVVPTHRRSKNRALGAADFQKFIFATCGSHHQHGPHPTLNNNKIPVCTVEDPTTEVNRVHPLLYR